MLRKILKQGRQFLRKVVPPPAVRYQGRYLPPNELRYCGTEFKDDETFVDSGRQEARRLIADFGLDADSSVLEIGCGPGRLPIGILEEFGSIKRFDGVDIDAASIAWCKRYLTRHNPRFRFHHIDAHHARYNPQGVRMDDQFALPFQADAFDIVYLHSVFANMEPPDVLVYCKEFARLLKPGGLVFLTAFIEEDVPDVTINPQDYRLAMSGALHVARYQKQFFYALVSEAGFEVARFGYAEDLGGQSTVHLKLR